MKKKRIIMIIVLLTIGFASVTTTLVINGKTNIGVNYDDFNVTFTEALLDGSKSDKATISEDKKTITFTTDKLIGIDETIKIDYKVKNISTQYNGDVAINCVGIDNEYIQVTSEFAGNSIPLVSPVNMNAGEVKSGYIEAKLIKLPTEDTKIEIKCSIDIEATSRDNYAYTVVFDSNGGSEIEDKTIILNEEYGELPSATKEGYVFLGWYDEEGNKIEASSQIKNKGNRTLYAKWANKTYNVNIVTKENGTSNVSNLSIEYTNSNKVTITPNDNYYISKVSCDNGYTTNVDIKKPVYGSQEVTINNNSNLSDSTCTFEFSQGMYPYDYIGNSQTFTVPLDGIYKIELWGASDANKGAYTSGNMELIKDDEFYLYVGEQSNSTEVTTFNNGTKSIFYNRMWRGIAGSGATDIRIVSGTWNNSSSLRSRIMVAAGSGGNGYYAGAGGGLNGYKGGSNAGNGGNGASQTSGGSSYSATSQSGFGVGAQSSVGGSTDLSGSGGGGYYGGGAGYAGDFYGGGGGGSSFISGHTGCVAIISSTNQSPKSGCTTGTTDNNCSIHYSGYIFTNTKMIDGAGYVWTNVKDAQEQMPNPNGGYYDLGQGHTGDGYARITLVSID